MPQRPGLGKGLGALIPPTSGSENIAPGESVLQLSVDTILRNPRQPRSSDFDKKDLQELANSIREHGVIQPLIVSPAKDGNYTLIAGERRLQASKLVGLDSVPAIIRQASDRELLELALIENIQRADLNPLEEADAYRQLTEDFGLSHEEVARRVGKSRPAVTNTIRLLQLSDAVKQALVESYSHADERDRDLEENSGARFRLSEGHARTLLGLSSHDDQDTALERIQASGLNVRQTEEMVKRWGTETESLPSSKEKKAVKKSKSPEVMDLENRLQACLGQEVKLRYAGGSGTVTIHYYSDEELDKILAKLL